jgi:ATP-dependent Clp protease protease subunit
MKTKTAMRKPPEKVRNKTPVPIPESVSKFWSVRCEAKDDKVSVGHLYLYGEIASESWWGDEVTPGLFKDDLDSLGDIDTLKVHIFSNGGDVFAGSAIYSQLKQLKSKGTQIDVYIEGIAASMATVVAMAGDNIYISEVAMMLIHNPMFILWGYYNADDLESLIADLEKTREPIIGAYANKTGMSRDEIIEIMDGEDGQGTWFTADEAIDASLADEYIPEESEEALGAVAYLGGDIYEKDKVTIDLSMYEDAPKLLNGRRKSAMGKTSKKAKAVVKPKAKVVDEVKTITCPNCNEEIEFEIPEDAEEIVTITCPECEEDFDYNTETDEVVEDDGEDDGAEGNADGEDDDGDDGEDDKSATDSFGKLMKAERKRVKDLRELKAVHPEHADIIDQAEDDGLSYAETSRKVMKAIASAKKTEGTKGKEKGDKFIAGMKKDTKTATAVGAAPHSGADDDGDPVASGIAASVAMFNKK